MTFRRFATGAALAIAGLAAAVGIGLLANSISGDSVGLGAEPLSAGETLAPATVKAENRQRQRRRRNRGGDETRTTTSPTLTDELSPAEPGDDNGGDRRGGDDNSGSGSSGSGSSGSGSSGSGSGGSGDSSHSGGSDDD
jgi:hypothetical protein